ncbi:hypothetical protein Hypma_012667 [Hypsizygus marmoreus]|uniref:SCP domain-containing protein n=1 Tax=Hypsizygus marmoreus TaxID=39966 RepID=A0A369IZF9_HYPMA|nr:hypothetical protein Hypma_005198 [Hypsizygus marmoreus]RDB20222.1 hypothetical protein Hypma_012667 [Hypsizygus marmoreus]
MLFSPASFALTLFLLSSATAVPVPDAAAYSDLVVRAPITPALRGAALNVAKQIKNKLRPQPNQAVFWSGMKIGQNGKTTSVKADAQKYAKANGKETINQALAKNNIKIPSPSQNPASSRLWDFASKAWALRSKGETNAIVGDTRPGSVYNRIEKPTLIKNPKVNKIVEHDMNKGTSSIVHQKKT